MIAIAINLVIGMAHTIYYAPQTENYDQYTVESNLLNDFETEYEDEDSLLSGFKGIKDYATTIASPVVWGLKLVEVFFRGINPFAFSLIDFTHPIERAMAQFLLLFRMLTIFLISMEAYLVFKNKKNT